LNFKSQVDASNVFKTNKQKHTKFSGFEKNINLLFEINKGEKSISVLSVDKKEEK